MVDARVNDPVASRVPCNTIHLRLSIFGQLNSLQRLASHQVADHELTEAVEVGCGALAYSSEARRLFCVIVSAQAEIANNLHLLVASGLTRSRASLLIGRHGLQVRHVREVGHVHLVERVSAEHKSLTRRQQHRCARLLMTVQKLRLMVKCLVGGIVHAWRLLRILRKLRQVQTIQEVNFANLVTYHDARDKLLALLEGWRRELHAKYRRDLLPVFAAIKILVTN